MLKTYQMCQFSQMNSIEAAHSSNYGCKHFSFPQIESLISNIEQFLLAKRTILYTFLPYTSRKWVSLSNYNNA